MMRPLNELIIIEGEKLLKVLKAIDMEGLRLTWPNDANLDFKALGQRACSEDPNDRPTFTTLVQELGERTSESAADVQDLGKLLNPPRRERLRKASMVVQEVKQTHWAVLKAAMLFKKGLAKRKREAAAAAAAAEIAAAAAAAEAAEAQAKAKARAEAAAKAEAAAAAKAEDDADAAASAEAVSAAAASATAAAAAATAEAEAAIAAASAAEAAVAKAAAVAAATAAEVALAKETAKDWLADPSARSTAAVPRLPSVTEDDERDGDGGDGADGGKPRAVARAVETPAAPREELSKVPRRQSIQLDNPDTVTALSRSMPQTAIKRPALYDEDSWVLGENGNVKRRPSSFAARPTPPPPRSKSKSKPYQRGALFKPGLFNRFHAFHIDSSDDDASDGEGGGTHKPRGGGKGVQWDHVTGAAGGAPRANRAAAEIRAAKNAPPPTERKNVRFAGSAAGGDDDDSDDDAIDVSDTSAHFAHDYDEDADAVGSAGESSAEGRVARPWYTSGVGPHGSVNTFGKFPKMIKLTFRAHSLAAEANSAVVTRLQRAEINPKMTMRAPKPIEVCKTEVVKPKGTDLTWKPIKISPEQLCGDRHELDAKLKVAVYSAGWKSSLVGATSMSLQEIMEGYNPDGQAPLRPLPLAWPLFNSKRSGSEQVGVLELVSFRIISIDDGSHDEHLFWEAKAPPKRAKPGGDSGKFPAWF